LATHDDLGSLISDGNVETSPDIEKATRFLRGVEGKRNLDHIVGKGFLIDSHRNLLLQLCDLATFSARKKEEQKAGLEIRSIDESDIDLIELLTYRGDEELADVIVWITGEEKRESGQGQCPRSVGDRPTGRCKYRTTREAQCNSVERSR